MFCPETAGGVKTCVPTLAKGDPSMAVYAPVVGSYQRATAAPASLVRLMVSARAVGM